MTAVAQDVTFEVPTGREEAWRFTPVKTIDHLLRLEAATGELAIDIDAPDEVSVASDLTTSTYVPWDRSSQVAWEQTKSVREISIPADTVVSRPIMVGLVGSPGTSASHVRIVLGTGSRAEVVLDHSGTGDNLTNVEVVVGDSANLTLVSIQDWADDAIHLGHQRLQVGRDAKLTSVIVTLGGKLVRLAPTVHYTGPGGDVDLLGLFFADAGQRFEHRSHVDHSQPNCRSNVVFKGALQGKNARSVWIGDVVIRPAAVGTQTYEINRNLILDDGPRADSVPNLEIETGDIQGAGHASATGRFDEEQLFYLRSRGIDEQQARRLVVLGFFADVLDHVDVPLIRTRLMRAVEAELGYGSDE